jgi:hypothetical protein
MGLPFFGERDMKKFIDALQVNIAHIENCTYL